MSQPPLSPARRVLQLAYPVIIAMVFQNGVNVLDTILVGQLEPAESIPGQAAIGISIILFWGIGGTLSAMFAVGTQALTARRFGAGDYEGAGQVFNDTAMVSLGVALVATVGTLYALPHIVPLMHSDPRVVEYGIQFSHWRFIGMWSMILTIVYKGFFDAIGRTKVHMVASIVMNLGNIGLNYIFIFGKWGAPRMGVEGSGFASMLATVLGLGIMVLATLDKGTRSKFGLYRFRRFDWSGVKGVIKVGVPGGIATFFLMTGFGAFLAIVGAIDKQATVDAVGQAAAFKAVTADLFALDAPVAWSHALYTQILESRAATYSAATKAIMDTMMILAVICIALGQATATLVGQSLGRKDPELAERFGWGAARLGAIVMAVIGGAILLFPDAVIGLFNKDPRIIESGRLPLQIVAASAPLIAVGMVLMQSLFGAGVTVFVMVAELVLHFFVLIPASYLFGVVLDWGILGLWLGAVLYIVLITAAMAWKFQSGTWKTSKL